MQSFERQIGGDVGCRMKAKNRYLLVCLKIGVK